MRTKGAKQRSYNPVSMTPKQAAQFLGIDQRALPALVRLGIIPSIKLGRGWTRYRLADLKTAKPGLRAHLRAAEKANGVTR